MTHAPLGELFEAYARVATPHLQAWAETDGVKDTEQVRPCLTEMGWEWKVERVPDYPALIEDEARKETITSSREARACAEALWRSNILVTPEVQDEHGNLVEEPTWAQVCDLSIDTMAAIMVNVLQRARTLYPTRDQLQRYYAECIKDLQRQTESTHPKMTVPIRNIAPESTPLQLSPRLELVPFALDDKNRLFRIEHVVTNLVNYEIFRYTWYKLEQVNGAEILDGESLLAETQRVLTALRLHKTGHLGAETAFFVDMQGHGSLFRLDEFRVPHSIKTLS